MLTVIHCRNCQYNQRSIVSPFSGEFDRCQRPLRDPHPVTGKQATANSYCTIERDELYGEYKCGPKGQYFTPRRHWWQIRFTTA